jgi:hypothetical protein
LIYACPFCGRKLWKILCNEGITTCNHCGRVFDTSSFHKVLSAAWMARLHKISDPLVMQATFELTDGEIGILRKYVLEEGYTHDELLKVLGKICA